MIEFRDIELSDASRIRRLRDCEVNKLTATAFDSLYSWKEHFGFSLFAEGDFAVVYSRLLNAYMYPMGCEEKSESFLREASASGKSFVFLSEEQAGRLKPLGYSIWEERDFDEYIYESRALALRAGNISANLRRKCRSFLKEHSVEILPIHGQTLPMAKSVVRSLGSDHGDLDAARMLIDSFSELELRGIILKTELGNALIMGYQNTADTFTMSVVAYNEPLTSDVVPVCIYSFAQTLCEEFPYIDLEEDMGREGLRTMKELYKPLLLLRSFTAEMK